MQLIIYLYIYAQSSEFHFKKNILYFLNRFERLSSLSTEEQFENIQL